MKVTLRTFGSETKASPTVAPEPVTHWIAISGIPASSSNSVSFNADNGVSDAGLMITALPAASAGPTLCATRFNGKLNGDIAATTPTGTRTVNPNLPAFPGDASSGIVSPRNRFASSADQVIV